MTRGGDLSVSAAGDLGVVDGSDYVQQRVIRRLSTNPGALVFHPEYGGGLPGMIGTPADVGVIQGIVAQQMAMEATVDQTVAPAVSVTGDNLGTVSVSITYLDASGVQTVTV